MTTAEEKSLASRRNFIRLSAGAVALIPVVNLLGCSDGGSGTSAGPTEPTGEKAAPAASPAQAQPATPAAGSATQQAQTSSPAPAESVSGGGAGGAELMKLEEGDPTATALGYRHAAADVDPSQYSRYQDGQICANCNLYQADASDDAEWGGCSIFPGKLVNANGWCNAYVGNA